MKKDNLTYNPDHFSVEKDHISKNYLLELKLCKQEENNLFLENTIFYKIFKFESFYGINSPMRINNEFGNEVEFNLVQHDTYSSHNDDCTHIREERPWVL